MTNFIQIAKHILANRFNINVTPAYLTFLVTWRCNLQCCMCDSWKNNDKSEEMNLDNIKKVLSQFGKLLGIRITG